jgi:ATP-binding cassette subfamily B protein
LLILDEATSAIDLATEKKILAGIQSLLHKSTIIFVTHRIETAKSADLVVYMRDGRIIRQGKYAQVIQAVKYAEMKSIPTKRRRNK